MSKPSERMELIPIEKRLLGHFYYNRVRPRTMPYELFECQLHMRHEERGCYMTTTLWCQVFDIRRHKDRDEGNYHLLIFDKEPSFFGHDIAVLESAETPIISTKVYYYDDGGGVDSWPKIVDRRFAHLRTILVKALHVFISNRIINTTDETASLDYKAIDQEIMEILKYEANITMLNLIKSTNAAKSFVI